MDNRSKANNPKRLHTVSPAELAVGVLDGNPNPIDLDATGIDPAPTSLDLPEEEHQEMCSNPRCTHHAVDECTACGSPLCEDCAASAHRGQGGLSAQSRKAVRNLKTAPRQFVL